MERGPSPIPPPPPLLSGTGSCERGGCITEREFLRGAPPRSAAMRFRAGSGSTRRNSRRGAARLAILRRYRRNAHRFGDRAAGRCTRGRRDRDRARPRRARNAPARLLQHRRSGIPTRGSRRFSGSGPHNASRFQSLLARRRGRRCSGSCRRHEANRRSGECIPGLGRFDNHRPQNGARLVGAFLSRVNPHRYFRANWIVS